MPDFVTVALDTGMPRLCGRDEKMCENGRLSGCEYRLATISASSGWLVPSGGQESDGWYEKEADR